MVDFPALLIAMPVLESLKAHHRRRMVRQAINLLPNRTREEVLGLHRTGGYEVDAILGTNTGSVILEDDQVHVALFPKIARLNHNCRPNAHYIFSPSRLTAEVIAYRAIEPGEEVTLSYVPLATKHDIRRSTLKENWGFDCSCAMCRDEPLKIQDSESGRRRIVELKGTAAHAKSEGFFQDAINIVEEWTLFAEEEGVPDPEPELHGTLAELYTLKAGKTGLPEDWAKARRYARMAVNGWLQLGSVDGEALEAARVQLRKLEGR
ncbi:hypothetical protein GQ53DRAFT_670224 [Thozetella sp. PMI_491]|nr:hypothetical protein GQ53DRAFT_670224 [Thozetella sp. PMI_491]